MAALYRHGVLHGDLHPRNLIWDGRDWVLLDLDAIRHPLHRLFARRRIEEKWGRVLFSLDGDSSVRDGFAAFLREAKLPWDPGRAWSRVQAWERRIRIERSPELASSA